VWINYGLTPDGEN